MKNNRLVAIATVAVLATGGVGYAESGGIPGVAHGWDKGSVPPPKKCHDWQILPGHNQNWHRFKVCVRR